MPTRRKRSDAAARRVEEFRERPLRPGHPGSRPKGRLLIIGGKEDKEDEKLILRRLVQLVGDGGKLVLMTLASESPREQWERYESMLRRIGIRHLHHLLVESRADAETPRALRTLEGANAVFFTGGDQLRITTLIGDTPVFSRVVEILAGGGTIAGTSAGASVMSETMLVGGAASESPRIGGELHLAPGFGFAHDMVIDQHFAERGRIGRLLAVVAQNPRVLGVGIDEDTAIEVEPFRRFTVLGSGGVTVVDGGEVTYTNVAEENRGRTLTVFGVRTHLLSQGDHFDLSTRRPRQRPAEAVDEIVGIGMEAQAEAADD